MATPSLNSVSPASGPPGQAITLLGAGFDAGAQCGCPVLVPTVFVGAGELQAQVPTAIVGPAGGTMIISVFVQNEDGSVSAGLPFTVRFPRTALQAWTTAAAVAEEIPGFRRGGRIADQTIETWIRSTAHMVTAAMRRRGLSLDPAQWPAADAATGFQSAAGWLETVNRMGAAARLAAAIGGEFAQGEWSLAKTLQADFVRELKALKDGEYDGLFRAGASTVDDSPAGGDIATDDGDAEQAFSKGQIF